VEPLPHFLLQILAGSPLLQRCNALALRHKQLNM
jgi:hypothetical protein